MDAPYRSSRRKGTRELMRIGASPNRAGRVKGSAARAMVDWYVGKFGPDDLRARVQRRGEHPGLASMDLTDRSFGILPGGWYPAETIHLLLESAFEGRSDDEIDELCRGAATFTFRMMMGGVNRALFGAFVSTDVYAKLLPRFWSAHFGDGTIEAVARGQNEHLVTTINWTGYHPHLFRLVNEYKRPLYDLMGCKDLEVQILREPARGDSYCQVLNRWR